MLSASCSSASPTPAGALRAPSEFRNSNFEIHALLSRWEQPDRSREGDGEAFRGRSPVPRLRDRRTAAKDAREGGALLRRARRETNLSGESLDSGSRSKRSRRRNPP